MLLFNIFSLSRVVWKWSSFSININHLLLEWNTRNANNIHISFDNDFFFNFNFNFKSIGSGKTYTSFGPEGSLDDEVSLEDDLPETAGIIVRSCRELLLAKEVLFRKYMINIYREGRSFSNHSTQWKNIKK